jgi:hypothetical protein
VSYGGGTDNEARVACVDNNMSLISSGEGQRKFLVVDNLIISYPVGTDKEELIFSMKDITIVLGGQSADVEEPERVGRAFFLRNPCDSIFIGSSHLGLMVK